MSSIYAPLSNQQVAQRFLAGQRASNPRLSTNGLQLVANGNRVLARKAPAGYVVLAAGSCVPHGCVSDEHLDVAAAIYAAEQQGAVSVTYQLSDTLDALPVHDSFLANVNKFLRAGMDAA